MKNEKQKILESLRPMIEKAKECGLWFHCKYQDLWITPQQLEKHHAKGEFIWGVCNWELRDPNDKINQLLSNIRDIEKEIDYYNRKIKANGTKDT